MDYWIILFCLATVQNRGNYTNYSCLWCVEKGEYLEVTLLGEQMTCRGERLFWKEWGRKLWLTTMWLSVKLCCSDRTTNCCFSNPGSIPTSACWEVMMVRLPDNCPFWKYGFQPFIVQPSHKKKWSLSSIGFLRGSTNFYV